MEPVGNGQYRVLRRLGSGGMAEVFLARHLGAAGFEKLVVVKRMLPHLAEEERNVAAFLAEARVAAALRHPNVVDVFEVAHDASGWFMAMEYLDGSNLRVLQRAALEANRPFPRELAVAIAADAARGLHHAHRCRDLQGRPLDVVHRDISPQNVVVTREGATKVVDFGIARSAFSKGDTEPGIVKGKLLYFSPEQARGERLGPASDQFSLGSVLWELTCGVRLRDARDDGELFRMIARGDVRPPSVALAGYPRDLEAIVLRSLATEPADRFADCGALATALDGWLAEQRADRSPERLGAEVRGLLPAVDPIVVEEDETSVVGPPEPPAAHRTNVSGEVDAFIGREHDLHALEHALTAARAVTLVGPGGTGKTRLARRLAQRRFSAGGCNVWLADLTEATSDTAVCASVAGAIGFPLSGIRGADAMADALGGALHARGPLILILDNCEQVVGSVSAALGRWLAQAPEARFLATTRETLHVRGEAVIELEPLGQGDALALFLDRAAAARRGRPFEPSQNEVISKIVEELDRMPLAIELAAARAAVLPPEKILERLPRRLDFLGTALRAAGARQATLRSTIEWSWNLLTEPERDALAQSGVFHGGFDAEAAEAVLDLSAHPGAPPVLDVLQALREKSLLRSVNAAADVRFGMYESIREFAREALVRGGREGDARLRHARWFAKTGELLADGVYSHGGVERLNRLVRERENLEGAVVFALMEKRLDLAIGALLALEPVFATRGPYEHQARRLLELLELAGNVAPTPPRLGWIRLSLGRAHRLGGNLVESELELEAAANAGRASGDARLEGLALGDLSINHRMVGRSKEGRETFKRAIPLLQQAGDKQFEAVVLGNFGLLLQVEGRHSDAQDVLERAHPMLVDVGDRRYESILLCYLGIAHHEQGRFDEANRCLHAAADGLRIVGDRRFEGFVAGCRAFVRQEEGAMQEAARLFGESLRTLEDVGARVFIAYVKWRHGAFLLETGQPLAARDPLRASLSFFRATQDRHLLPLALALCGAADALLGERESAHGALDEAEDAATAVQRPDLAVTARLLGGLLDVSIASARGTEGSGRKSILAAAAARAAQIDPGHQMDGGYATVRFARRLLQRTLREATGAVSKQQP